MIKSFFTVLIFVFCTFNTNAQWTISNEKHNLYLEKKIYSTTRKK